MQPVFVSRSSQTSREDSVNEIKKRVETLKSSEGSGTEWQQIALFPEGTTTNRKCLISFKTVCTKVFFDNYEDTWINWRVHLGAFQPGVAVQPVVVRWPNNFDCVTWAFVGPSIWKLLWLQLCQFHTFLEIEYLPVYEPNEEEKSDPTLFANNVRHVMASALKIPVMGFSYRDGLEFSDRYHLSRQPPVAKLIVLGSLNREIGLTYDMMDEWLPLLVRRYRSTPSISREEFIDLLDLSSETIKSDNFQSFCKMIYTPQAEIDLKQYCILNCLWCCRVTRKLDYLKFIIQLLGHDDLDNVPEVVINQVLSVLNLNYPPSSHFFKLSFISFDYFMKKLSVEKLDFI